MEVLVICQLSSFPSREGDRGQGRRIQKECGRYLKERDSSGAHTPVFWIPSLVPFPLPFLLPSAREEGTGKRRTDNRATVSRQLPKKGHREVASETLLPIILEVGTLGHILLTDPHGPTSKGLWWQRLSLSVSSLLLGRRRDREERKRL